MKKFLAGFVVMLLALAVLGHFFPTVESAPTEDAVQAQAYQELLWLELETANELLPPTPPPTIDEWSVDGYGWEFRDGEWVWGETP